MPRKESIEFENVEALGTLNVVASAALGAMTLALMLSVKMPSLMPEKPGIIPLIKSPWFMISLGVSLLISHIPLSIRSRQISGELKRINESLMFLTDSLSVNLRTGMNFVEALRRALDKVTSPVLRRRLSILVSMMEGGEDLATAIKRVTYGLPARAVEILNTLIPASESGGRAARVISIASDFSRRMNAFERTKRSSLSPYFYISFMALAVFEGATLFLLYLTKSFQSLQTGGESVIGSAIPAEEAWSLIYYMNMIIVILSSLFVSKVVRGKIKYYSDYFLLFMLVHLLLLGIAPVYILLGGIGVPKAPFSGVP